MVYTERLVEIKVNFHLLSQSSGLCSSSSASYITVFVIMFVRKHDFTSRDLMLKLKRY